ncbi:hypothetical protein Cgig2_019841 [Carnegiea gigantea]|uniref:Uncharacterized protein n=1 Tax=Carnegiea gigantea TaxID=171969 RepID=A0A9Q1JU87_9CARY|nr:hypothetical protein Cgig2_019841 [Carnegiea gigantea]
MRILEGKKREWWMYLTTLGLCIAFLVQKGSWLRNMMRLKKLISSALSSIHRDPSSTQLESQMPKVTIDLSAYHPLNFMSKGAYKSDHNDNQDVDFNVNHIYKTYKEEEECKESLVDLDDYSINDDNDIDELLNADLEYEIPRNINAKVVDDDRNPLKYVEQNVSKWKYAAPNSNGRSVYNQGFKTRSRVGHFIAQNQGRARARARSTIAVMVASLPRQNSLPLFAQNRDLPCSHHWSRCTKAREAEGEERLTNGGREREREREREEQNEDCRERREAEKEEC